MNCKKCGYNLDKLPSMFCPSCGTSNSKKNELYVEQYDAADAEAKKKRILFKVGIGVGGVALLALLALFGLIVFGDQIMPGEYVGGNGAWFNSKVIFLEDENE